MFIENFISLSSISLLFMPHRMCYLWTPELVRFHLVSDALIVLAYFSIAVTLIYIVRQQKNIPLNWLVLLFAGLIISGGIVHLFNIWIWHPNYWISGYIKAVTALVSVATAIALIKLVPQIKVLLSSQHIAAVNQRLQHKIEELEQIQVILRQKERFLQTLLNNVSDGIAACDGEGRITQFNPACEVLFGLPQKSLPSEEWSKHYRLYYPDGKTVLKHKDIPLVRAFRGEKVRNAEITTISPSGVLRNLSVNGDPIMNAEGKSIGAVIMAHDISDRKQAEAAIYQLNEELETRVQQRTKELEISNQVLKKEIIERQKAEDSLRSSMTTNRAILDAIPDLILRINKQGVLIDFEAHNGENLWLKPKPELLGKPIDEVFPQELALPIGNSVKLTFATDRLQLLECQLSTNDRVNSYEVRIVMIGTNEVMAIVRDITERKQAEADIHKTLEQEKKLNELKSRFVTMASHEFRTPLATILSSCELLEHYGFKWTEAKKLTHFYRIQASVKHMTTLLNDVLLLGKADADKLEFNPIEINLPEFCQNLIEEIQSSSHTHQIVFLIENCLEDDSDRDFVVGMDEKLLRLMLNNLLSNAIKYSPDRDRVIFTLICQAKQAIFQVQDFGIGIPVEEQDRLFDSFHRAGNVGSIPGTGLGMAITKRAIELHQGTITIESQIEIGTTFTVTLPVLSTK